MQPSQKTVLNMFGDIRYAPQGQYKGSGNILKCCLLVLFSVQYLDLSISRKGAASTDASGCMAAHFIQTPSI